MAMPTCTPRHGVYWLLTVLLGGGVAPAQSSGRCGLGDGEAYRRLGEFACPLTDRCGS